MSGLNRGAGREAEIGGKGEGEGERSRQRQMDGVKRGNGEGELTASDRPL